MTILQVTPAQMQQVTISEEKAYSFALQQLEEFEESVPERQVVRREIQRELSDGILTLHASYTFCEDIAQQEPILLDNAGS